MDHFFDRFLMVQETAHEQVLQEIRSGHKHGHWIWFTFPQVQGLGSSSTSQYYAIPDLTTAQAYAAHPVLGSNLRQVAAALLSLPETDIRRILPWPDDLKVRSSMTLFALAAPDEPLFRQVLDKYYSGSPCPYTLDILSIRKEDTPWNG